MQASLPSRLWEGGQEIARLAARAAIRSHRPLCWAISCCAPNVIARSTAGLSAMVPARRAVSRRSGSVQLGTVVERGQPVFTLHAASPGELAYALEYATGQTEAVHVMEDAR